MFDFGIGYTELFVVAMVAIIVIGPKDLPRVLRAVGKTVGKMRGMAREFQGHLDSRHERGGARGREEGIPGPEDRRPPSIRCQRSRPRTARPPKPRRPRTISRSSSASPQHAEKSTYGIMTQHDIDSTEAPLIEHLIELRRRLIYCVVGFIVAFIGSFCFSSDILHYLILPFKWGTATM